MASVQETNTGLCWSFDWKISVLTLLLVTVTCSLGNWQLKRADEKRLLLAAFQQQQQASPQAIESLDNTEWHAHRRVILQGQFDNSKNWLLDNRVYQGKVGFEVISPLVLAANGSTVLVNRGWVPGDVARRSLPQIGAVNGLVSIQASIYRSPGVPVMLAEDQLGEEWPKVIQQFELDLLKKDLPGEVFPHLLRIDPFSQGAFIADWPIVNIQPEKHTGYAVQWFSMAAVLLLLFIGRSSNMMDLLKRKR